MIKFYSLHCPECDRAERLMMAKQIDYTIVDDEKECIRVATENNTDEIPFAVIDGVFYDSKKLKEYIANK